ncbi:MAG: aldo/keto reductase [Gemmatimonadetes bacterium]|nr:aldo/keto reductase [Gemmatimonadota bacterium]
MLATAAIPSTGQRIPRVGLGTWQTFDIRPGRPDYQSRRGNLAETIRVFFEGGGTVIDSSPMYGASEAVVGELLAERSLRSRAFLATKVWTSGAGQGIVQMDDSIAKLRAGSPLELMQIHNLVDWRTHLATLRRWKDAGRIRYLGITHYQSSAIEAVAQIVRTEPLDFVQMNLSLDEPEAAATLLALCRDRGVAFIANRPFGGGGALRRVRSMTLPPWCEEMGIRSWSQYLLKWVLAHPEVTCAIPGTGNPRHCADNLAAGRGPIPDQAGRTRLARHWREV